MLLGRKAMTNLDSIWKSRDITLHKGSYSQSYGFFSSHVQMWELDHKEGWAPKNCCFQTTVLKKTLESLLNSKEIQLVNPKGNQPWISSVQFSRLVMSDLLWSHGPQPARLPCPSPTPGACSNSCPWSQWCHPTISSSVIPFSSFLQSFPASGSLSINQFFTSSGQNIGTSSSVFSNK